MQTQLFFIFFSLLINSISSARHLDSCVVTVNLIKESFLNKQISAFKKEWNPCFQQKDTVMTAEENDAITWKAKVFYLKGKIAFIAETNWKNKNAISRITIFSSAIKTKSGICIGQRFQDIKSKVSDKIPSEPDGYLSLVDKQDSAIYLSMNITKYPKLFYGVNALSDVPKSLKVESIIIVKG